MPFTAFVLKNYARCLLLLLFGLLLTVWPAPCARAAGDTGAWRKNMEIAQKAMKERRTEETNKHLQAALKEAIQFTGRDTSKLIETYEWLARFNFRTRRPGEAFEFANRGVKLSQTHFRPNSAELGESLMGFGYLVGYYRRFEEAEGWMKEGIRILAFKTGRFSDRVAYAEVDFGEICRINDRNAAAKEHFLTGLKVLEISKTTTSFDHTWGTHFLYRVVQQYQGADYAGATAALSGLAKVSAAEGKTEEAVEYFDKLVKTAGKERNQPDLVPRALLDYALFRRQLKQWDKAEALLQQALAVDIKRFGEKDGRLYPVLRALMSLYQESGNATQADQLAERMLQAKEKFPGITHEGLADEWIKLGDSRITGNNLAGAERAYVQGLALDEKMRGANNLVHLPLLGKMVALYEKSGEDSKLESLLAKQITIVADAFGPQAKALLPYLDKQSAVVRRMGQTDKANSIEAKAKGIRDANP